METRIRTLIRDSTHDLNDTTRQFLLTIVCVITNQGSSNPNCLNFLMDAYKIYQGVPPSYLSLLKSNET